jgi:hypothetical protein
MTEATERIATDGVVWRQLHWRRPLDAERVVGVLRQWAADQRSPLLVLEARANQDGIRYLLGAPAQVGEHSVTALVGSLATVTDFDADSHRIDVNAAATLRASTRHRPLRTDDLPAAARALLTGLSGLRDDEQVVLQVVLGARRVPLAIPNQSPSSIVMPWWHVAWMGKGGTVDGEKRTALRSKVGDHGFACVIRLGATAGSRRRRSQLLLDLLAGLRTSEAPGVKLSMTGEHPGRLNRAKAPWRWLLRLNVRELAITTGWPVGDDENLPGQPDLHPRQVAARELAVPGDRIVAATNAPGVLGQLGYSVTDSLRHSWIIGPNGTGKSTLLLNLITQDLEAGRPVVVIEPKDLVADVLARIPAHRQDDVVLLDATDAAPVGINPLMRHGRRPEMVADSLLATFHALYGDGLGPRSTDILANALAVLARRNDASLVMLPLLLTNDGFRRSLTQQTIRDDPIAAAPFWSWFEALSDDARSQIVAPLQNKLRPLIRPGLRSVLAQQSPRFNVRQVLTEAKVLLVPLQSGVLGPATAELLGALVVGELWLAIRERVAIPEADRVPVMIYVDEVQTFLKLPTDLSDALATSRSLRGSWHLAHQYREQLNPAMRAAFEANARSRIAFQLNAADARAMAAGQSVVGPEDFGLLPAYHVYASLMRGNSLQPWASGITLPPPPECSDPDEIRLRSRRQYGQPLDEIEAGFAALIHDHVAAADAPTGRRRRSTS